MPRLVLGATIIAALAGPSLSTSALGNPFGKPQHCKDMEIGEV